MTKIDNKIPFIYISGWKGSGKGSSSYKWLERYFNNIECYAAGGRTDVEKMVDDLNGIISECLDRYGHEPILVGNSYGGFLASLFPQAQVLINPALFPAETLPQIADLTDDEINRFKHWQEKRSATNSHRSRRNTYCVCTEGDELIPDHRTEVVSTNVPVMIPGGAHRLTDDQRDQYLLPVLAELVRPTFRIVKLSCDSPERLMQGEFCEHASRRFPTAFTSKQDAQECLQRHIRRNRAGGAKPAIGYMIREIYGDNLRTAYRQWSYTPAGQPLAEAYIDCTVPFNGREPQTLPFHKGDYVIAHWCGDLFLGLIFGEPPSPAKVEKMKQRAQERMRKGEPSYFRLDSSDDSYVVDFIDEYHGHPSAAEVFPLPFDASEIPEEVKASLHWADKYKTD